MFSFLVKEISKGDDGEIKFHNFMEALYYLPFTEGPVFISHLDYSCGLDIIKLVEYHPNKVEGCSYYLKKKGFSGYFYLTGY